MDPDVVVSLTSYKGRIYNKRFIDVLEQLVTQVTQYHYKTVLVLSYDEFANKEKDLPTEVLDLKSNNNFEILWTKENTKALKKYNPTSKKYKDIPIICLGDDTIYSRCLVELVYGMYLEHNKGRFKPDCICAQMSTVDKICVPWRIRIFPPNCMIDIPEELFKEFHEHDDLFYGLRLYLNSTKVVNFPILRHLVLQGGYFGQEKTLNQVYHSFDQAEIIKEFVDNHPEYKIE
jgi:hypothetical protein